MAIQTQFKAQYKIQFKRLAAIAVVTLGYLTVVPLMASEVGREGIAAALGHRDRVLDAQTQTSAPCDRQSPGRSMVQLAARSRGDGPWQAVVVLGSADCSPRRGVI